VKKILLILILTFFCGCSDNSSQDPEYTPLISEAYFWNQTNGYQTDTLYIDVQMYFLVFRGWDNDGDITHVCMTFYEPPDSETPYSGPDCFELTPQTCGTMLYTTDSFTVDGPPRERRLDLQLQDAAGHMSNVYTVYYEIAEYSRLH